jgi:general stress protein 26
MASKRSQIEMTTDEIDDFLAVPRTLNIATIGPQGVPHLVAMWFGFVDGDKFSTGKIGFWTFARSQKVVNLKRDPRMTCLVEAGIRYNELQGVELVGTGRLIDNQDEIVEIAIATSTRHAGPVNDAGRAFIEIQARKRIGIVLEVEQVVSWDHSKLGGGY